MDQYSSSSGGGNRQPPRRELLGPRPTPLKVRKDSHKAKKPPVAPPAPASHHHLPPPQPPRPPVIIYAVSPKIIHTNPSEFMNLVQRLTGADNSTSTSTNHHHRHQTHHRPPLSPAATFATIERTKIPLEENVTTGYDYSILDTRPGGILSPGPAGLIRPVPPAFFSDPISPLVSLYHQHQQDHLNALQQIQNTTGVLPSPSTAAFLSPNPMLSPASIEFLTRLLDQ